MRWFVSFDELSCFLFGYPKIQRMRVNNFGSILTIFFPDDVGDTWVQFLEGCPLKFGKAKTIQNPVQFLTTFDFVREYLRNGWTNRKSEKQLMNYILSNVERKNRELWSTNEKVIDAHIDPPKWTFFGRLYFSP